MDGTYLFIEATYFTRSINSHFGSDEAYAEFQSELAREPDSGSVIPGASPLRKVRWGDRRRGMGKRGGPRVIYIHIPDLRVLFMLDVYGKDEADDLTPVEKRELRVLSNQLVEELRNRRVRGNL